MKNKIKILFVGNFYKNKGSQNIGAKIIDVIDNEKYEVDYIQLFKNPIYRLVFVTYKLLTSSCDIIHLEIYSGRYFDFMARYVINISKFLKKKLLLNMQGGALPEFHQNSGDRVIKTLRKGDVRVSPSKRIIEHFSGKLEIEYLPSFINRKNFPYRFFEDANTKLLWVRSFREIYNPEMPIKALSILSKEYPGLSLTMIGPDGGLMDKCKNLAKSLNLTDKVEFLGPVENSKLHRYFNTHSIYLNTTSFESFGFALVEAASCGIPIITSKVGEIPYIWKEDLEVLFFEDKSLEGLVKSIEILISDSSKRKLLSQNAKGKADFFTWHSFRKKFYSIVKNLSDA